jgi:hypothetical protein
VNRTLLIVVVEWRTSAVVEGRTSSVLTRRTSSVVVDAELQGFPDPELSHATVVVIPRPSVVRGASVVTAAPLSETQKSASVTSLYNMIRTSFVF